MYASYVTASNPLYQAVAPELVAPAEGYARTAYRMVFGEDETFEGYREI